MNPRCNTLLCGNTAAWQCVQGGRTIYKCATCYERNFANLEGDWEEIQPIMQSRIMGLRPPNVKL